MEFGLNFIENFLNRLRASNGYQQSFEEKVQAGDIDGALSLMETHNLRVAKAIKEYDMDKHQVMQRQDKPVFDAKGHFKGWVKRWKLALGYHQYINEIALVFMYGRPVKWTQESDNTDKAFEAYTKFIKNTHFNSKVREAKRLAGSETQSALLFHCYRGKDGKAKCLIKVLAKSLMICTLSETSTTACFTLHVAITSQRLLVAIHTMWIYTWMMLYTIASEVATGGLLSRKRTLLEKSLLSSLSRKLSGMAHSL